jgi:DNA-binding response OmpR family regulator
LVLKKNILIVEDEMIIALDLKRILEKNNFEVAGISDNHQKTLDYIKEKKIDLILMDINIKGSIDGIQSCNFIFPKYKIPIIFISAHNEEETIQMVKESFAQGYIIKPFRYEVLLVSIHFCLRKNLEKKTTLEQNKIYLKNNFCFDFEKNSLYIDNKESFLTQKEKKILYLLCKNKNSYVSYESLYSYVWEKEIININKIRGSIFRIKRKIPFLQIYNSKEHGYKIE